MKIDDMLRDLRDGAQSVTCGGVTVEREVRWEGWTRVEVGVVSRDGVTIESRRLS